jgi:hypothetical protein
MGNSEKNFWKKEKGEEKTENRVEWKHLTGRRNICPILFETHPFK